MKKIFTKKISIILSVSLLFVTIFNTTNKANAWWGIVDTSIDMPSIAEEAMIYAEEVMQYEEEYGNNLKEWAKRAAINAIKQAALKAIQKKMNSSYESKMITNYGKYLYTAPIQKSAKQMNTFFTSVTGGTSSSLNYEGIGGSIGISGSFGSNYSSYLVKQAKKSINGVNLKVTITDVVDDPTKPFSSGNMQGIMSFLECSNNPYCMSMAAQTKYSQLVEKNMNIAKEEAVDGFMPTKVNGIIKAPAEAAKNMVDNVAQMGVDTIVNAMNNDDSSESLIDTGQSFVTQITDAIDQYSSDSSDDSSLDDCIPFETDDTSNACSS
jgi:hypothetical protein